MSHIISITHHGDFKNTTKFLNAVTQGAYINNILDKYGQMGVDALRASTPKDTGLTSESWYYEIKHPSNDVYEIVWSNSNTIYPSNGTTVAILLQYGHATGTGGWVEGRDFINPAIQPIFDQLADDAWKEVIS